MTKKEKKLLFRILAAFLCLIGIVIGEKTGLIFLKGHGFLRLLVYLIPYLIVGYDVLMEAAVNIAHGQVFDEDFLMMIATFGAFFVGEYTEAAGVMIFFQVGELFETHAVGKSRRSIKALMDIAPEYANVLRDGTYVKADPEEVHPGDLITVHPGERVPLDGTVTEGSSYLDTSSLTGESVPRFAAPGDNVFSGSINGEGTLFVRVTKEYADSTVSRILELVENAASRKAPVEQFISKFARYYTPAVTVSAILLAFIPPIFFHGAWMEWVRRACTFLVISCPCALVISVPLGFFGGIGAASKLGVLVKGSGFLEALSQVETLVFDKTGTLTEGSFEVTAFHENVPELSALAARLESFSDHPAAAAIRRFYGKPIDSSTVSQAEEHPGEGVSAFIEGKKYFAGNRKLMERNGIDLPEIPGNGTLIYVSDEEKLLGWFLISDQVKENAASALAKMKESGVRKTVMLTGDRKEAAAQIADLLKIDEFRAELLPGDKVSALEAIMSTNTGKEKTAFVGDGINDAPVLTRADVGIAMGSLGADAAIEAADIVLMDDDLSKISATVKIARRTLVIVRENIVFALSVKFIVLVLGALGLSSMWLAVFADVGVAVIAILNAMRTLYFGKK